MIDWCKETCLTQGDGYDDLCGTLDVGFNFFSSEVIFEVKSTN